MLILTRILFYLALMLLIVGGPVWWQLNGGDLSLLQSSRMLSTQMTSEYSVLEHLQILILAIIVGLCAMTIWLQKDHPALSFMILVPALIAVVRELDLFLDYFLIDHAWQVITALLVSLSGVYLWHRRRSLRIGWVRYQPQIPFVLMLVAFALLLGVAGIIGHSPFWVSLLGEGYDRRIKIAVEEMIELAAYWVWLIAAIEYGYHSLLYRKRHNGVDQRRRNRRRVS